MQCRTKQLPCATYNVNCLLIFISNPTSTDKVTARFFAAKYASILLRVNVQPADFYVQKDTVGPSLKIRKTEDLPQNIVDIHKRRPIWRPLFKMATKTTLMILNAHPHVTYYLG